MKYIFILLLSINVSALEVTLGLYTDHIGGDYYEDNKLIAIETDKLFVSRFTNSYKRESIAIGGVYSRSISDSFSYGLYYGVVSGYCLEAYVSDIEYNKNFFKNSYCQEYILPLFAPFIKITKGGASIKLTNSSRAITVGLSLNIT